jgi:hypothetical protein
LARLLRESEFRTIIPQEANFFFVPVSCCALRFSQPTQELRNTYPKMRIGEIYTEVMTNYPYWNRSQGLDHFHICAHDEGAALFRRARGACRNAIGFYTTADYSSGTGEYVPHKDISVQPNTQMGLSPTHSDQGTGGIGINPALRTQLAFFAGNLQNGRVRPVVLNYFQNDTDTQQQATVNCRLTSTDVTWKRLSFAYAWRGGACGARAWLMDSFMAVCR